MAAKKKTTSKKLENSVSKEEINDKKLSLKVEKNEDKQVFWFIFIVFIVFGSFLGPYLYLENQKKFEAYDIEWKIEDYPNLRVYHGIFETLLRQGNTHNIFLRTDPRENNVSVNGDLSSFKTGSYISFNGDINSCRGELPRALTDLTSYLRNGIGLSQVLVGASTLEYYNETGRPFATCSSVSDSTVILIERGNESRIIQSGENPFCYTIEVTSCDDITSIEKFIIESHQRLYQTLNNQ